FNDNVMTKVMTLLRDASRGAAGLDFVDAARRERAAAAVRKGIGAIVWLQVSEAGRRTGWAQQHDEVTGEPRWGRAFEPRGISGNETVGVVRFLMGLEDPG